jgi:drug/metabolite transporter (DMT)-like permease
MTWLALSLVAAFSLATADALTKKFFGDTSSYAMGLARLIYALPLTAGTLLVIDHPVLGNAFWTCVAVALPLEFAAFYCYMTAIKSSPLSLSVPFLSFTPLFMIITGWLVLGERVSPSGCAGIACVVAGSYVLNLSRRNEGIMGPFRAIVRERGSRFMLMAACIYSLTSVLGKKGIELSSPLFFAAVYYSLFSVMMLALFPLFSAGGRGGAVFSRPLKGAAIGLCMAAMVFSHMAAISMVQAAYMISVKRLSLLFGVAYGALLFKERNIGERLAGALVMLAGAVIITFSAR